MGLVRRGGAAFVIGRVSLRSRQRLGPLNRGPSLVLSVGTFNLNNLFSRFNNEAEVSEPPEEDAVISSSTTFPVSDPTARASAAIAGVWS